MPERRFQFSLATMLVVMACCAVILVIRKALIYEPPTDKFPLYEQAPGTRSAWAVVGPNRVGIRLVARNDRDGSVRIEDGRGGAVVNHAPANQQELIDAASWLDVVQFELEPTPDRIDIIEARIFDHETRRLVTEIDPAFGWRVLAPDVIQVYGLSKQLPKKLDAWFRLYSYEPGVPVAMLGTSPTSSCSLPGGTITLQDIRAGFWNYGARRLQASGSSDQEGVSLVLLWNGEWQGVNYQITAVSASGEKAHTSVPHYLDFEQQGRDQPIYFDMPLSEVDHFELRPFGGRHRFFFEAVTLPKVSETPFSKPPTAQVTVAGREIESEIQDFAPLAMRVTTHRGNWANGVASRSDSRPFVTPRQDGATDQDEAFTITYRTEGRIGIRPQFRFLEKSSRTFVPGSQLGPRATMRTIDAGYNDYFTPLEQIEAIEVTIQP
ncbi:MAG: hypothetical protein KY475_23615 [Planctomycetes bacterium]|nr:hypothetical protein [Planctomycetota bacterium]